MLETARMYRGIISKILSNSILDHLFVPKHHWERKIARKHLKNIHVFPTRSQVLIFVVQTYGMISSNADHNLVFKRMISSNAVNSPSYALSTSSSGSTAADIVVVAP
jgi:hypothetical protein